MSSNPTTQPGPPIDPLTMILAAMSGALLMMIVVLLVILPAEEAPLWTVVVAIAGPLAAAAVVQALPVPRSGARAPDVDRAALTTAVILRAALLEFPAMVCFVAAFVVNDALAYIPAGALSCVLIWMLARPSRIRAKMAAG